MALNLAKANAQATSTPMRRVGGKAEGLLRLTALGARVPPFFALDARVLYDELQAAQRFDAFESAVKRVLALDPSQANGNYDALCQAAQAHILTLEPSPQLRARLVRELSSFSGPYAVRSSMVGEDSAAHSYAGQLESYLDQHNIDEVLDAIRKVWASAFSSRALAYRYRANEQGTLPEVAVVVQKMVRGDRSGVCFTANPLNGRRDELLITACYGLGEGVVDGSCNTDEIVASPDGRELSIKVAHKDTQVVSLEHGSGTEHRPVPEALRDQRCLREHEVAEIATTCAKLARALGAPQDIEWTLESGVLYLLQSRPITTLPVPDNRDGPRVVFDNSNIQESYCGVTTPLTFSFASRAYASVYLQTARALSIPDGVLAEYDSVFKNLLGLVRGRVYYNINNWYRGLLLLPAFKRNKADMEKMMGLEHPVDFVEDEQLSFGQALARIPRLFLTLIRLMRAIKQLDRTVPAWLARFDRVYASFDRKRLPENTFSELMEKKARVDKELLHHWTTPIINDLFVSSATGNLRRLIAAAGMPDAAAVESALLGGEDGIESTEPTRMLLRIARTISQHEEAKRALITSSDATVYDDLRRVAPDIAAQVDEYIARFGDRVMGELKLESISLHEDPSFVFHVLKSYLNRPDLDPEELVTKERARREAAERELEKRLRGFARLRLKGVLKRARKAVKNRENMRLSRTRMFGLYRDIYRALGLRLWEAQKLNDPRDVFYLTVEELEAYHEGRAVSADLAPIAEARKAEFARYEALDLPHQFETVGPVYHGNRYLDRAPAVISDDSDVLRGIGCSAGVVEAEARVVMSPRDELSLDGRILVTVRTDPGWAPLFPSAGGVLVERGSTLSHSAVVARELGIPAVVGVPRLLERIQSGERIRLDGTTGEVRKLKEQSR